MQKANPLSMRSIDGLIIRGMLNQCDGFKTDEKRRVLYHFVRWQGMNV